MGSTISESTRYEVRQRASYRCEYCQLPDAAGTVTFHVEHVIPKFHNGPSTLENYAWACPQCNHYKGPNLAGYDRHGNLTPLYNPRAELWADHFKLNGAHIEGVTPTGHVTAFVLRMNEEERVELRQALIDIGKW